MSDQTRENSKWFKEKAVVMREYVKGHKEIFSAVAGRGFLRMPGFLYDAETDLETAAKLKLSEANLAILQDTIERELKQTGLSYDLSYKNLLYAWELSKQVLMEAWDKELAGIKQGMAAKEEALARLEIQTAGRSIILLEAKTAIELESEALKNQIAALDDDTAAYEVTLANQKLLTAQKKLELIPILEQIIAKEQELLASERLKIPEEQALLAAIQQTAAKKEELVPYIAELATATEEYGVELAEQTQIELQIADQRVLEAGIAIEKAEVRTEEANARAAIEEKNLELAQAKIETEDTGHEADKSILGTQISTQVTLKEAEKVSDAAINASDKAANQAVIADKETIITINEDTGETSAAERAEITAAQIYSQANYTVQQTEEIATLEQESKVTATLTHMLKM